MSDETTESQHLKLKKGRQVKPLLKLSRNSKTQLIINFYCMPVVVVSLTLSSLY